MECMARYGLATVLGLCLLAGCGKSSAPSGGTGAANDVPVIKETDPNSNPMAKAAYDFLDAVLKGDTQRASARMTPTAMQRITSSGMTFSLPGLQTCTFKIGEVRSPSAEQAIVQCVLTDTSEGQPHSEEMCCLLKSVENDWRVCGIAYGTTQDKPWTLTDFETGKSMMIPKPGMVLARPNNGQSANGATQANLTPAVTPPAPLGPVGGAPGNGPANVNSPNPGTAGLGMPAVGPTNATQPSLPYTAQEPLGSERR